MTRYAAAEYGPWQRWYVKTGDAYKAVVPIREGLDSVRTAAVLTYLFQICFLMLQEVFALLLIL